MTHWFSIESKGKNTLYVNGEALPLTYGNIPEIWVTCFGLDHVQSLCVLAHWTLSSMHGLVYVWGRLFKVLNFTIWEKQSYFWMRFLFRHLNGKKKIWNCEFKILCLYLQYWVNLQLFYETHLWNSNPCSHSLIGSNDLSEDKMVSW